MGGGKEGGERGGGRDERGRTVGKVGSGGAENNGGGGGGWEMRGCGVEWWEGWRVKT